jgi:hypothetical protein
MTLHPIFDHVMINLLGYGKCSKIMAEICFDFYDIMSSHPWYEQLGVFEEVRIQLLFASDFLHAVIVKISNLAEAYVLATTQQEYEHFIHDPSSPRPHTHAFHLSLFSITKYDLLNDDTIEPTMIVETLETISSIQDDNPQCDIVNLNEDTIADSVLDDYVYKNDEDNYIMVSNVAAYIMVNDYIPDHTNSNVSSNISNTMLQEKGESILVKHQLYDINNNILSTKPDSPSTSATTISVRGETIITTTIRKPSIYKFKHHLSNMKGDIMVYYTKEQKFKFFHHASFFGFGNIHQCGSFFDEWGVQNLSLGERSVDSVIIRSIDLVHGTLFFNLQLRFGKIIAGKIIIIVIDIYTLDNRDDNDLHSALHDAGKSSNFTTQIWNLIQKS